MSLVRAWRRLLQPAQITAKARGARTGTLALIVAVGATCFVATSIVSTTVQKTIEQGSGVEYAGANIVVRTGHGLGATLSAGAVDPAIGEGELEEARAIPGVTIVDGIVRAAAAIRLPNNDPRQLTLESLPDDSGSRWQTLVDGKLPANRGEVALSTATLDRLGFSIGDIVTLVKPGAGSATFRIVGAIDVGGSLRYGLMNYGVVTTPVARAFADVAGYNEVRIATRSESDTDHILPKLASALPGGFPQRSAELIQGSASGYAISLAATTAALATLSTINALLALLAFASVSWALFPTRRRSLALLRTVGASRGQLVASTLLSSAVVAGAGGLIGAAVGAAVTPGLFWLLAFVPGFPTIPVATIDFEPAVLALVPVLSAACGLLAGGCVVAPVLRVSASGREREPSRLRRSLMVLVAAVLILAGMLATIAFSLNGQHGAALVSVSVLGAVVVIASPLLYALAARTAGVLVRRRWPVRELAALQIRATPARAAAAGLAVTAATGVIALGFTLLGSFGASVERSQELSTDPQIVLGTYTGDSEISPEILSWFRQASGVAATATVSIADDAELRGPDPSDPIILNGNVATARFEDLATTAPHALRLDAMSPDVIYLPETDHPPVAEGSTVVLSGRDEQASAPLTVQYVPDLPFQALVVPQRLDQVGAHAVPVAMWLDVASDVDRKATIDNIRGMATLAGISTLTGSIVNAQENADALNVVSLLVTAGFIIAAALAAWGASLCVTLTIEQRRRDLAILRTIGMDAASTKRLIRFEAWTVGLLACAIGAGAGVAIGWAAWAVPAGVVGLPVAVAFPVVPVVVAIAVVLFIILRAIAWPIDSVLYMSPARALRDY